MLDENGAPLWHRSPDSVPMEAGAESAGICRRRDHRCGPERREVRVMTILLPSNIKVHLALGFIDMVRFWHLFPTVADRRIGG
jgi:hypothetical protein